MSAINLKDFILLFLAKVFISMVFMISTAFQMFLSNLFIYNNVRSFYRGIDLFQLIKNVKLI